MLIGFGTTGSCGQMGNHPEPPSYKSKQPGIQEIDSCLEGAVVVAVLLFLGHPQSPYRSRTSETQSRWFEARHSLVFAKHPHPLQNGIGGGGWPLEFHSEFHFPFSGWKTASMEVWDVGPPPPPVPLRRLPGHSQEDARRLRKFQTEGGAPADLGMPGASGDDGRGAGRGILFPGPTHLSCSL